MPDLGVVGKKGNLGERMIRQPNGWQTAFLKVIVAGTFVMNYLAAKDTADGSPSPPSQKQRRPGTFKDIKWPVVAGTRTIKIDVKFTPDTTPRPRLIVKANTAIGVNVDVTATAAAGAGWKTVGPITVNPTADGILEVWRECNIDDMGLECNWDNVVVT